MHTNIVKRESGLTMMMLICIKPRLSKIWSSIKQHWDWVGKTEGHLKTVMETMSIAHQINVDNAYVPK